ncbi:MAG: hypothetical protein NPIRA04_05000 [Nitrospirales bacterium]|nr:MAG: hypothetical protein NPIRA04_05000 [Nitrospirales bacterium]
MRFFCQQGFDWTAVKESIQVNIDQGEILRGGSTITQQLAKNLFLTSAQTPMRKLKEAIITYQLEKHLSKTRILELYVNVIELGPGIFGIEAAARKYFHKSANRITQGEAARIAAILPKPLRMLPTENNTYVQARVKHILREIHTTHPHGRACKNSPQIGFIQFVNELLRERQYNPLL